MRAQQKQLLSENWIFWGRFFRVEDEIKMIAAKPHATGTTATTSAAATTATTTATKGQETKLDENCEKPENEKSAETKIKNKRKVLAQKCQVQFFICKKSFMSTRKFAVGEKWS